MVTSVRLSYDRSSFNIPDGGLVLGAPCRLEHQIELLADLQNDNPRVQLTIDSTRLEKDAPKLLARFLASLNGAELEEAFHLWTATLNVPPSRFEEVLRYLPAGTCRWFDLPLEKKLIAFAGAAILVRPVSFCFVGDLHLERNAQIYMMNTLSALVRSSGNRLILFWAYHLDVPQTLKFYFNGFGQNAA